MTLKTTYEQESACFEYKEPLETGQVLLQLARSTIVHMALGERPDMWYGLILNTRFNPIEIFAGPKVCMLANAKL